MVVKRIIFLIALSISYQSFAQVNPLVFQTDFGLKDGAVAAMKGVAFSVSPKLQMFDLTHDIPPYNIWEAAYRLNQTAPYWPAGTVFVSVVDPGVGSERKSIVMKTKSGHFFVTPDNGTLTLVAETLGIEDVRIIDERINRLQDSEESYTFHGRDVYAYTGARLAADVISFEQVGPKYQEGIIKIQYQKPALVGNVIKGSIDILDIQYGNLWTNIDMKTFRNLSVEHGDKLVIKIYEGDALRYDGAMIFGKTFSDVSRGEPVAYLNSLLHLAIGINEGSFAEKFKISSGPEWRVEVVKN